MSTPACEAPARHVARWRAIGCTVHVETALATDLAPARSLVDGIVTDVDEVASRFRDDSDLALVNAHPGRWVEVDPLLAAAVRVALAAAERTGGVVHPLLGRPLVELGYDRTFDLLAARAGTPSGPAPDPVPLDAWRDVEVREDAVRIPRGTALDLGATAKAWIADLAATALVEHGTGPAVVSVGGDLRTVGGPWEVGVAERPDVDPEELVVVDGALATSSTRVRRWRRGAVEAHHLVDPRTGAPARTTWRTVTVAAPTCVEANTASTAVVVLGDDAAGWLEAHGLAARLVAADGAVRTLGAWPTSSDPIPHPHATDRPSGVPR